MLRFLLIEKLISGQVPGWSSLLESIDNISKQVISFNGEKKAIKLYNTLTIRAYKATVLEGIATGLGTGGIFSVFFGGYSLAFWYGAKLIINEGYTGGQVVNVVFAMLTGSM